MFLIFVFLLIHIQNFAYIVTFPFFLLPWKLISLWSIICHFLAIFFISLYSSGALHLSKAWSSLFITFPFICLLTFTKTAMEINFLYPSFFPELIMSLNHNLFFIKFYCFRKTAVTNWKRSAPSRTDYKVLQFWHCNPILLQLITLQAAIRFVDMPKGIGITSQGLKKYSFGRSCSFSTLFLPV